jgi:hypothetical protein
VRLRVPWATARSNHSDAVSCSDLGMAEEEPAVAGAGCVGAGFPGPQAASSERNASQGTEQRTGEIDGIIFSNWGNRSPEILLGLREYCHDRFGRQSHA